MMQSGARWVLVGSLVSILMIGGLGLAMGKKVEKEEATVQVEVEQKKIETGQKKEEDEKANVKTGRKTLGNQAVKRGDTNLFKSEKEGELRLELIWEKKLDAPARCIGVVPKFGVKESEMAPGKAPLSHFPVRALVTEDRREITFFDDKGKVESTKKLSRNEQAIISENGEYVGITKENRSKDKIYSPSDFELRDRNNRLIWKKENIGIAPFIEISPDGKTTVVAVNPFGGDLVEGYHGLDFYNSDGELIKHVEIDTSDFEMEFSGDGKLFAVKSKRDLVVFNQKGEELWRFDLEGLDLDKIRISNNGEYIAVSCLDFRKSKNRVYFLNRTGKLLEFYDVTLGEIVLAFSPESNYVVMGDYQNIFLFETKNAKLLWKQRPSDAEFRFDSISISNDEKIIVIGARHYMPKIRDPRYIYVYDSSGNKLTERKLGPECTGDVNVETIDGNQVSVITYEKFFLFEIKNGY